MKVQPEKSVAQVLRDAADLIERDGWCQRAYFSGRANCAVAAIRGEAFSSGGDLANRAVRTLQALVGRAIDWNDAPERTQADVVATLREAADLAEQELRA